MTPAILAQGWARVLLGQQHVPLLLQRTSWLLKQQKTAGVQPELTSHWEPPDLQVLHCRSPTARQHPPLPGSAPARRSGSPTQHCSWCIEVQAAWPSQPLAIRNLGWIHQQFSFVAVWFSYSMFPRQGWLKSTESLPSKWVGSDCQGWGLLALDLLHSCYFCGESGNRVSCTSQVKQQLSWLFQVVYFRGLVEGFFNFWQWVYSSCLWGAGGSLQMCMLVSLVVVFSSRFRTSAIFPRRWCFAGQ